MAEMMSWCVWPEPARQSCLSRVGLTSASVECSRGGQLSGLDRTCEQRQWRTQRHPERGTKKPQLRQEPRVSVRDLLKVARRLGSYFLPLELSPEFQFPCWRQVLKEFRVALCPLPSRLHLFVRQRLEAHIHRSWGSLTAAGDAVHIRLWTEAV